MFFSCYHCGGPCRGAGGFLQVGLFWAGLRVRMTCISQNAVPGSGQMSCLGGMKVHVFFERVLHDLLIPLQ
jgi:hypothetical protein